MLPFQIPHVLSFVVILAQACRLTSPWLLVVGAAEVEKRPSVLGPQAKELSKTPDLYERHYSTPNILIVILGSNRF